MKRVKRRYIALQLESEGQPTERELIDTIWTAVTKLYGEVGASLTGLTLIELDVGRQIVVIRVSLAALCMVRASLATVISIAGKTAAVHVLAVSGTLRTLRAGKR